MTETPKIITRHARSGGQMRQSPQLLSAPPPTSWIGKEEGFTLPLLLSHSFGWDGGKE